MAPVRVDVGVDVEVGTRWRRDNRPDFPGIAVWVDAVAEVEIDAEAFGLAAAPAPAPAPVEAEGGERVPQTVDAWSPEYGKVWRPLSGSGREPRPGLLLSVVRAGVVVACPTPLPDPPSGVLARALARMERPEGAERPKVLAVDVQPPPPPPRRMPSQKSYGDVRALVGILVEVLVGRRTATHVAPWSAPEVRGKLRTPRYARTTSLKSVRLSESGNGVEALALLRDGGRTRAVALRFDRADDSRWHCTALQTG